jgi:hypothetical protein
VKHETRCPWVRQNDADSEWQLPFLCGAAAAQMILYGRHDARFQAPASATLAVPAAVRRADQQAIWQAIVAESQVCPLPAGVRYDGSPEPEQIWEGDALCWSTFPKALARLLARGIELPSGNLAGVPATVRSLGSEASVENAVIASLDRGVAAALLIDGSHWVVVYRYDVEDDGEIAVYYRNGLMPKVQSNAPIGLSTFESELSAVADGVFDGKYVAVTAASSVPVVAPQPHAMEMRAPGGAPPARRRRRPRLPRPPVGRERVPFPEGLGTELPGRIARNRQWQLAFRGARPRVVLPVRLRSGRGPGFYAVNFVTDRVGRSVRTGTAILDASTLKPLLIAGIDDEEQELPQLLDPSEARRMLVERASRLQASAEAAWVAREPDPSCDDVVQEAGEAPPVDPLTGIDPASLSLEGELIWTMCDQSTSPFLPFFVVKGTDAYTGASRTLHLRADGKWLGEITRRMAGI